MRKSEQTDRRSRCKYLCRGSSYRDGLPEDQKPYIAWKTPFIDLISDNIRPFHRNCNETAVYFRLNLTDVSKREFAGLQKCFVKQILVFDRVGVAYLFANDFCKFDQLTVVAAV